MTAKIFARVMACGTAALALAGAATVFLSSSTAAQPRLTGAATDERVAVKGGPRSFVLYTPKNLKPNAPLLFVFHGSGGDGPGMREVTGFEFDRLADQQGFLVVYPDGYETTWNDCRKGSPQPARVMKIDDESFVEAMIAKEAADHGIDRKRVFAAGWSNGGQFSYRLGIERTTIFAGAAAISASLPTDDNLDCTKSGAAIPVMVINGTADPINPFNGGMVTLGSARLGNVLSTDGTGEYFAKLSGISAAPQTTRLPHKNATDPTYVDRKVWMAANGKPGIVVYAVHGGSHVVPQPYFNFGGGQTQDLNAPVVIWEFFSQLPSRP